MMFDDIFMKYCNNRTEIENLYWFLIFKTYIHGCSTILRAPQLEFEISLDMDSAVDDKFEDVYLYFLDGQTLHVRLPRVPIVVNACQSGPYKKVFTSDGIKHKLTTSSYDPLIVWIFLIEHNLMHQYDYFKSLLSQ